MAFEPNPPLLRLDESSFPVNEQDVSEILGLPIGETDVDFGLSTDAIKRWAISYGQVGNCYKVTPVDICKKIAACDTVNDQFKLNFILLLSNVFFEGSSTPYINTRMIQFNGDFDNCKKYNWCKYLIQCLQEQYVVWNENREKRFFKGSLVFLLVSSFLQLFH